MRPLVLSLAVTMIFAAPSGFAHCDWIKGPVVVSAQKALESGDVTPVMRWIAPADETEIRRAFERTLAARALGPVAGDVADLWFFETVVRLHRASEGEPYTGLKGASYHPETGIEMADAAIDTNSLAAVEKTLTSAIRSELQARFAAVIEAQKHADDNVDAGRRFVHAYAEWIHYVDAVHRNTRHAAGHR